MSCEKISIRPYAHTLTCRWSTPKKTHTKCEENIGRHLKKKKKERQKCSDVYTFFTSTLKEITASVILIITHNMSFQLKKTGAAGSGGAVGAQRGHNLGAAGAQWAQWGCGGGSEGAQRQRGDGELQ
jgi:hypothetical protein